MKRILIALLSMFISYNAIAENVLHVNSNVVSEVFKQHIPPAKQVPALFEYNQIVKERGGITPNEIRRVCAAAGWQTDFAHAMTDGAKCDAFVEDLLKNASVKMYAVCGKEKGKSGGTEKCINDFQALTTTMIQATGLAKLYVYAKDKTDKVVCSNTPRSETTTVTSNVRGGMNAGVTPATTMNTHYVQCKAIDKNIFYEFKFNNTRGTSDSTNHRNFKTGICSIYGYKLQPAKSKDNREKAGWDICENATQNACGMINNGLAKAHSGYVASWGPWKTTLSTGAHGRVNEAGAGYKLDASNLPYCILTANVGTRADGTAYERTAFGLDGRHFLTSDIRTQGNQELHSYIRKYVESTGLKITEFECAETYVTVQLKGRSDPDDMITCTINGSTVDFFFDDLSESKDKYIQGTKQALDCMVSGGTFTGKKCIGLGKEQCEVVRAANAVSCPECKQIKWNPETNICELPASASAANLKRGLNYTAIVGGAVVGIVITVGTLGTSSAPTIAILGGVGIETAGSVIELIAQMRIDEKADKFFTQSANCKNQKCAEKLIKDYLQELANQSDSLLDSELTTADEEFARLFDLIPSDAEFYTKIVENGIRGETVESNKRGTFEKGSWNSDQIWRAVGIGLQIIPTVASVGWKIAKKSDKLVKSTAKLRTKLDDASRYIEKALDIKKVEVADELSYIKALKNKASNNFDYYVNQCISGGDCVGLPYDNLTWQEWDELRKALAEEGDVMLFPKFVPDSETSLRKYVMQFKKKYFNIDFGPYVEWDYKSAIESGLGYGHYRVNLSELSPADIDDLMNILTEQGVHFERQATNKGAFLIVREEDAKKIISTKPMSYNGPKSINNQASSTPFESLKPTMSPEKTSSGLRFGKRDFNAVTDSTSGIKYYEYVFDGVEPELTAENIMKDFGYRSIVFERNNQYIIAVFENSDDFNIFQKTLEQKNLNIIGKFDDTSDLKSGSKQMPREQPNKVVSGSNEDVFSKVYYSMSDEELYAKLKYVYENSYVGNEIDRAAAIRALQQVGVFDPQIASEMAKDIANEVTSRIIDNGGADFITAMKNWPALSQNERDILAKNLHELITTVRREHTGNTIVKTFYDPLSPTGGSHLSPDPNGRWVRTFEYNIGEPTIEGVLNTIIHENTHALQTVKKSSIHPYFAEWAQTHKFTPEENYTLYYDNIREIEARYVAEEATQRIMDLLDRWWL